MIRPVVVIALLLSSAVMMREVASDWRQGPPPPENSTKKAASAGDTAPLPQPKPLQPALSGPLPDLKDGYLFNPERMLAGAEPPPKDEEKSEENELENLSGLATKMSDVTYAGSLIADNFRRAIIVYTEAAKGKAPAASPAQPASRSSKAKPPAPAAGGEKHAQLEVGDIIDGYVVASIQPDKLIFTKGDETVEKLLHDPEKKRQAPPPQAKAVPPGGGGPPRPGGVQSTTIGGAAPAGPGTVAPPTSSTPGGGAGNPPTSPATHNTPIPPVPAVPQAVNVPSSSSPPVRKTVISRQPSTLPGPDISRVIRQSQGGADEVAVPMPPAPGGSTSNDAVDMPPMPGGGN